MKYFSTLIFSLLFISIPLNISAQSKVAHINTQQLISEMPEVIAAQNELKKLEDQYAKELRNICKRISNKSSELPGRC